MSLFISNSTQLLNYKGFKLLRISLGFIVNVALYSSFSLSIANSLLERPRVLLVYIVIMLNRSLFVDIRRQGLYVNDSIDSFSL